MEDCAAVPGAARFAGTMAADTKPLPTLTPHHLARTGRGWRIAQAVALAGYAALLALLAARPAAAQRILWAGVVPALPAVFLVHPGIWRNVCPLATLGSLNGGAGEGRLRAAAAVRIGVVGVVGFTLSVAARPGVLNDDAGALMVFLAALAATAWIRGGRGPRKSGFCNAICPMLPVERLYGQAPLLGVSNPRCPTCTACTARGCPDVAPRAALLHMLGPRENRHGWATTPHGAFSAAFPGLVAGYFLATDGVSLLGGPLAAMALAGAASWLAVAWIARAASLPPERVLPGCAAVAFALFYGLGAGEVAGAWGAGGPMAWGIRGLATLLLVTWWVRLRHA